MIRERAIQFGDGAALVGVLSEARQGETAGSGKPALLILNAGILHHVGPSRLHVTLARQMAGAGFPTLRFDISGIGDSEPRRDGMHVDEAVIAEVRQAMDYLAQKKGVTSFILGGICSGADSSFRAALADPRVVGIFQIDGYAYLNLRHHYHHYAPRVFHLAPWLRFGRKLIGRLRTGLGLPMGKGAQPDALATFVRRFPPKSEVESGLQTLSARGVRQLHVYTGGQSLHYNYRDQFWDNFRAVDFQGQAHHEYLPDADHTFTGLEQQKLLVECLSSWIRKTWPR